MNLHVPGVPKDEFIETYGEDAFRQVDHRYIISWNHQAFVLDGWDQNDIE